MTSNELHLREYKDEDHERTFQWLQDDETRHFTGTRQAPTPDGHWQWLKETRQRGDVHLVAVYEGDRHIGNLRYTDIDIENSRAEIQMYLGDKSVRGRGLGTLTMILGRRYAFQELGLNRVYGFVFDFNERGLRMDLSAGFRVEGRLRSHKCIAGHFHDVTIVGSLASDE